MKFLLQFIFIFNFLNGFSQELSLQELLSLKDLKKENINSFNFLSNFHKIEEEDSCYMHFVSGYPMDFIHYYELKISNDSDNLIELSFSRPVIIERLLSEMKARQFKLIENFNNYRNDQTESYYEKDKTRISIISSYFYWRPDIIDPKLAFTVYIKFNK